MIVCETNQRIWNARIRDHNEFVFYFSMFDKPTVIIGDLTAASYNISTYGICRGVVCWLLLISVVQIHLLSGVTSPLGQEACSSD